MIVRPVGMTIEEMMIRPQYGQKISAAPKRGKSRATQMQALNKAFDDLRRYLEKLIEKERQERGFARREALYQGRELEGEDDEGRAMKGQGWQVEGLELIPRGAIDEKQVSSFQTLRTVADIMTTDVRTLSLDDKLEDAVKLFEEASNRVCE